MTINQEDQRKEAFELFIRALAAAPETLVKPLTGMEYAKHAVDGAKETVGITRALNLFSKH